MSPVATTQFDLRTDLRAWGKESLWVLGDSGIVLNNKYTQDAYLIDTIDGLSGSDLRLSVEDRVGRDGEQPLRSFKGGHTVTLSGHIRAGNLGKLRRMESDLHGALRVLEEIPIYIRRFGIYDDFSTDTLSSYYTVDAGLVILNGSLTPVTAGTSRKIIYKDFSFRDVRVTAEIALPDVPAGSVDILLRRVDASNGLFARLDLGGGTISSYTASAPVPGNLSGINRVWFSASIEGDILTADIYENDPFTDPFQKPLSSVVAAVPTHTPPLGTGVLGQCGAVINSLTLEPLQFDSLRIEPIDPADLIMWARPGAAIAGVEEQRTATTFDRAFQIVLRSGHSNFFGQALRQRRIASAGGNWTTSLLGRIYDRTYPLVYTHFLDATGTPGGTANYMFVENAGNSEAMPVFVLRGGMIGASIKNVTTGEVIGVNRSINTGELLNIDCANRTITAADGSLRGAKKAGTQWITLQPGFNLVQLLVEAFDAEASFEIYFRDAHV